MIPQELQNLIDTFTRNYDAYKNPKYKEAELRLEFLDKVIELLGWDIGNKDGNTEYYKEVIVESDLKGTRPNYCIQFGGKKLFYIETKKPAVNLAIDKSPAFQVRSYGWNSKMPYCLLTDFEEFAVYNTTIKPKESDDAKVGRIFLCRYDELDKLSNDKKLNNWERIYNLFSKQAEKQGLNKVDITKGTLSVDDDFLQEIEKWRKLLAQDIVKIPQSIEIENLNEVVQKNYR